MQDGFLAAVDRLPEEDLEAWGDFPPFAAGPDEVLVARVGPLAGEGEGGRGGAAGGEEAAHLDRAGVVPVERGKGLFRGRAVVALGYPGGVGVAAAGACPSALGGRRWLGAVGQDVRHLPILPPALSRARVPAPQGK